MKRTIAVFRTSASSKGDINVAGTPTTVAILGVPDYGSCFAITVGGTLPPENGKLAAEARLPSGR